MRQEVVSLKKFFEKHCGVLAAFALVITTVAANSACVYTIHQEKLPADAKKLRKF